MHGIMEVKIMFCPNCGSHVDDGAKFCSNCGTSFVPDTNSEPVQAPATEPAPAPEPAPAAPVAPAAPAPEPVYKPNPAPVTPPPSKEPETNTLCLIGFIGSLVSILLAGTTALVSLILSIVGMVSAGKKNQKGKGLALTGIIISAVLILIWGVVLILGIAGIAEYTKKYDSYKPTKVTKETTKWTFDDITEWTTDDPTEWTEDETEWTEEETTEETTEATTEETTTAETTTAETTAETTIETQKGSFLDSVGNDKTGKVPLTSGKWCTFYEAGGFSKETIEHEQAQDMSTMSIIGLFVLDLEQDPETVGKAQMASMESQGAKAVTGARVKLGGYDAVQCYGMYPDNTVLVVWYFRGDDGLLRKVTVEFPTSNTNAFSLVEKGYKLDR